MSTYSEMQPRVTVHSDINNKISLLFHVVLITYLISSHC